MHSTTTTYHKGRGKPKDSRQEGESGGGLPTVAQPTVKQSIPVKGVVAAVEVVKGVDEETEGREPREGEDQVHCAGKSIFVSSSCCMRGDRSCRTWP